ncbi:DNA-processing protein DprA [Lacibacterium aquatile]|uniref:DNA-processing protein DprA n=1 Tax=Lacibacterium aquatile TaxID=1168082 RepID=A0ABW5DX66_9PROT
MSRKKLSTTERLAALRLIRTDSIGPITFHQLLARFGSAEAALKAVPDLAKRGGRAKPLILASVATAEKEIAAVGATGAGLVGWCEPGYPALLAKLEDAPPFLSIAGDPAKADMPMVALVGARNASLNARKLAEKLAKDLAEAGMVVASGLARGIDQAAHIGALPVNGMTAAVIAGGIDTIYPPEHGDLQRAIGTDGLLIAEMPPGTQPQARHFPRRNRIISGMSLGTVIVEAALGSGSLITAKFAAEQGREVMAIPGSPLDPRCKGGNSLLKDGAALVEDAADILAILSPFAHRVGEPPTPNFDGPPPVDPDDVTLAAARKTLLQLLGPAPVTVDELVRRCQFSPAVIQTVLLELDLAGRLERQPGGGVALLLA